MLSCTILHKKQRYYVIKVECKINICILGCESSRKYVIIHVGDHIASIDYQR